MTDLHCHILPGIDDGAKDTAVSLELLPLKMPAMDYTPVCEPDAPISVQVEAPDLCPRYMAHYVRNLSLIHISYSLMMIPASPLVGWIGDQTGQAGAGLAVLGCLISASALLVCCLLYTS